MSIGQLIAKLLSQGIFQMDLDWVDSSEFPEVPAKALVTGD
jgi:hypothetical protein